jgi:hypothetical protein
MINYEISDITPFLDEAKIDFELRRRFYITIEDKQSESAAALLRILEIKKKIVSIWWEEWKLNNSEH